MRLFGAKTDIPVTKGRTNGNEHRKPASIKDLAGGVYFSASRD